MRSDGSRLTGLGGLFQNSVIIQLGLLDRSMRNLLKITGFVQPMHFVLNDPFPKGPMGREHLFAYTEYKVRHFQ